MKISIGSAVCLLLLTGCAVPPAGMPNRSRTGLIGMSKHDLLQCAGVPARTQRLGEFEFLAFAGQESADDGVSGEKNAARFCEAAFVLKDGTVRKVNYRGRNGWLLPKGEQCTFIVKNCLLP